MFRFKPVVAGESQIGFLSGDEVRAANGVEKGRKLVCAHPSLIGPRYKRHQTQKTLMSVFDSLIFQPNDTPAQKVDIPGFARQSAMKASDVCVQAFSVGFASLMTAAVLVGFKQFVDLKAFLMARAGHLKMHTGMCSFSGHFMNCRSQIATREFLLGSYYSEDSRNITATASQFCLKLKRKNQPELSLVKGAKHG